MKFLGAVFVAFLAGSQLFAQAAPVGGFGNVVLPAMGRVPAGTNPWGNVVFPAMPQGAASLSPGYKGSAGNRYGNMIGGFGAYGNAGRANRRPRTSGIYAYPVYIGGFGYGSNYAPDQQAAPQSDSGAPNQPPPPVVINQYFGQPPPDQGPPPDAASNSNFHFYQTPANSPGAEPAPSDASYYLIAFKDHTVYSAVAYYTEGDTLHYFTAGNVHNQASLSLVDRQLTDQLNRPRNVEVRLP